MLVCYKYRLPKIWTYSVQMSFFIFSNCQMVMVSSKKTKRHIIFQGYHTSVLYFYLLLPPLPQSPAYLPSNHLNNINYSWMNFHKYQVLIDRCNSYPFTLFCSFIQYEFHFFHLLIMIKSWVYWAITNMLKTVQKWIEIEKKNNLVSFHFKDIVQLIPPQPG